MLDYQRSHKYSYGPAAQLLKHGDRINLLDGAGLDLSSSSFYNVLFNCYHDQGNATVKLGYNNNKSLKQDIVRVKSEAKQEFNEKNIQHPECNRAAQGSKILRSQKTEKNYKVTVTYIQLTEEEAKIKRAIIERILRKGYTQKDI